jgi:hypothetical protein
MNLDLSEKRALAMSEFLKKRSELASINFTTPGFGETKAIASNDTDEVRPQNRRVETWVRCEHPTLGERATGPENGWENLKPCAEKSVVISKKMRSDLQFIAPKQCAKNQPPQCEIGTRPPTLIGERHQSAAHLTIIFIPSRAIRASTPSSRATAAIFAASWRSLAVTISEPQCVIIARDTRSFAHQPSWVLTGA